MRASVFSKQSQAEGSRRKSRTVSSSNEDCRTSRPAAPSFCCERKKSIKLVQRARFSSRRSSMTQLGHSSLLRLGVEESTRAEKRARAPKKTKRERSIFRVAREWVFEEKTKE